MSASFGDRRVTTPPRIRPTRRSSSRSRSRVPQTLLFVPMADLIGRMRLGNTLSTVMLTYPTLLVPFIAWLLMGYVKTVQKELEEQVMIDGASHWRARCHSASICRKIRPRKRASGTRSA